jgi:hypothetical protein
MTYQGVVHNGQLFVEGGVPLPEGTVVNIDLLNVSAPGTQKDSAPAPESQPTLYEQLKPFIGSIKDLPADFSRRHDYYIHGTPDE